MSKDSGYDDREYQTCTKCIALAAENAILKAKASQFESTLLETIKARDEWEREYIDVCQIANAFENKIVELRDQRDQWKKHYDARSTWVPDMDLLMEDLKETSDENEKYRNHIKTLSGANECPACGERYYNQPDFETFHHVEIERNKLQDENKRIHERYKNIELANENMSRNDHVTFGAILTSNAELVESLSAMIKALADNNLLAEFKASAAAKIVLAKHGGGK